MILGLTTRVQAQFTMVPTITTYAGNGASTTSGDGGPAINAGIAGPYGIALDSSGNLYIASRSENTVRKVDASTGVITRFAGMGTAGYSGDGGPATSAALSYPASLAFDSAGNLYIAEFGNHVIRKIDTSGTISTVVGTGTSGNTGNGGQATSAKLGGPWGISFDPSGNLYITDSSYAVVRKVTKSNGVISAFAGTGTAGYTGDGAAATAAKLSGPIGVASDSSGNIYFTERGNNVLREVSVTTGYISTVAGTGVAGSNGDGGPATSAQLNYPAEVRVDSGGNLYFVDNTNAVVRKITASTGNINTVAGIIGTAGLVGDGGPATAALLNGPWGLALSPSGDIYVSEVGNLRVRKISSTLEFSQTATFSATAVGSSSSQNILVQANANINITSIVVPASQGSKQEYTVGTVTGCAVDPTGSTPTPAGSTCTIPIIFIPAYAGQRRLPLQIVVTSGNVTTAYSVGLVGTGMGPQTAATPGIITTIAGTGTAGYSGNGGPATAARLNGNRGTTVDSFGNIYFMDVSNYVVRKIDAVTGYISTVAGTGVAGYSGDGGLATNAKITPWNSITTDAVGNIYFSDSNYMRKVNVATGIVTTVGGTGTSSYNGDGGLATQANMGIARGIAIDGTGNIYLSDSTNYRIRKIDASTARISTIAGTGSPGYAGDGGPATSATFATNNVQGLSLDSAGNIYFADWANNVIRKITASTGVITTVVGTGVPGYSGDGGVATNAQLRLPRTVQVDPAGNLYVADGGNNVVREVEAGTQVIRTIAGIANNPNTGNTGDNGPATSALLYDVNDVSLDAVGNLYISSSSGNVVRRVDVNSGTLIWSTTTPVAATDSADGTEIATLSNIGNADLSLQTPNSGQNPSVAMNFLWKSSSTCPQLGSTASSARLSAGNSCTLAIDFHPLSAGSISGSVSIADNSLNVSNATQTVRLSGMASNEVPTVSVAATSSTYGSTSVTLNATISYSSLSAAPTGAVTFTVGGGTAVTGICTSSTYSETCTATYNPTSFTVGTYTITATLAADSNYQVASGTGTLTVNPASPTLTWNGPNPISYGTALGATQLNATANVAGTLTYSPASGSVPSTGLHVLTVTFVPTDTTDYTNATASVALQVAQMTPTVTWPNPAAITYGTTLSSTQLNATSTTAGTFSYSPAAGAALNAGILTLTATFTPTDTTNYSTVTTSVSLTVNRATPAMTWVNPAAVTYGTSLSATQLNATSATAGSFVYTPSAGVILNAGPQTLSTTFVPTDTTNYTATTATVTLAVNKAIPEVTWITSTAISYGTALSSTQLNASSSIGGTYAYTPAAGTVLSGGAHTLSVAFVPTDATNYTSTTATVTLTVNQATPAITWPTPSGVTYGTALGATQLNASSTTAGSFSYSPASGTVLSAGTHAIAATFTPTDPTSYTTATATVSLVVSQVNPTITWATPNAMVYGLPLSSTQCNASSPVAGTFVYSPAAGVELNAGSQTLTVTFTPTDTANYAKSTAAVLLVVKQANPVITWAAPTGITAGTALSATQLNAAASVAGTFTYSPASGTVLTAGTHTLSGTFTPTDTSNYETLTATTAITVSQATASITWSTPLPIGYRTALSATQLNATANVAGTFSYSPAAGTILTAGSHLLTATFTPADLSSYGASTATVTINVTLGAPAIAWAAPSAITYGTALTASQLNATSSAAGSFVYSPGAGAVLGTGAQTLRVTFLPTDAADYSPATGSVVLTVNQATTVTTILSSTATAVASGPVTLVASVGAVTGAGIPTGTVTFYDGTTALTSATLVGGTASSSITTLSAGTTHSITAAYSGDTNFLTSISSPASVAVGTADLTFANSGAVDQVISSSQSAAYSFILTPTYTTYPDAVSFSVANLPSGYTATFSPATVSSTAGIQTITLTIKNSAKAGLQMQPFFGSGVKTLIAFALLVPVGLYRRRTTLARWAACLLFLAGTFGVLAGMSGCAGGGFAEPTLVVTAKSGNISHSVTVGLTVE